MKKIVLIVAVLLGAATMSAANRVKDNNLELNVNVDKLSTYLMLDATQSQLATDYAEQLNSEIKFAKYAKSSKRARRVQKAVYTNLGQMRYTLSKDQYAKYLRLMNVTLRNKGLDHYMAEL